MNKYKVYTTKEGRFGVSQETKNGCPWDHAVQMGHYDTAEKARDWAAGHAGSRPHEIKMPH